MVRRNLSLFLAGDALVTRPWSHIEDSSFIKLVDEMRAADATIIHLETLIHEYKGYPQTDSGGTYVASPPGIAAELKWAGVNMVSHASNHSFDYGSMGILETLTHIGTAGLTLAGTGRDLQQARSPQYLACEGRTVALLSMTSTFASYGKASPSRPDLHGRPGLNPLSLTDRRVITITPPMARVLWRVASLLCRNGEKPNLSKFKLLGTDICVRDCISFARGLRIAPDDLAANLNAIRDAASRAAVTVVAVHSHDEGKWLTRFAHSAVAYSRLICSLTRPLRAAVDRALF